MHIMKMESQPSDREVLAGLVERVTYQNADNGFCVIRVKARGHRDLVTVVGHAAVISAGEWITAAGDWTNDRTHGQQFKARFLKTSAPTSVEGIEKYLGSGMIRGIGPVYAKKLLRAFGDKVFDVIEAEPGRLRDVDGIGRTEISLLPASQAPPSPDPARCSRRSCSRAGSGRSLRPARRPRRGRPSRLRMPPAMPDMPPPRLTLSPIHRHAGGAMPPFKLRGPIGSTDGIRFRGCCHLARSGEAAQAGPAARRELCRDYHERPPWSSATSSALSSFTTSSARLVLDNNRRVRRIGCQPPPPLFLPAITGIADLYAQAFRRPAKLLFAEAELLTVGQHLPGRPLSAGQGVAQKFVDLPCIRRLVGVAAADGERVVGPHRQASLVPNNIRCSNSF